MQPGDVIAERFEVVAFVASGGMGEVWRAHDRLASCDVGLKTMRTDAHEATRFLREARVLAEISHPALVKYVAHGETRGGALYLAMEWLDGEDLARRLGRGDLTYGESIAIARRVADALSALHARGVVHRDVKPGNVFLPAGAAERAKLLDLGVAWLEATLHRTAAGMLIGTPAYMSPEQATGGTIDARADVFALGCLLFECIARRRPFVGDHPLAILAKIVLESPPRLRELMPDVPPAVDELVGRMLEKEPSFRPRDGRELVDALARVPDRIEAPLRPSVLPPREGIAARELRLVSVIVAGPSPLDAELDALIAVVDPYGGRTQRIADGSLLVLFTPRGAVTDQVALAARCALSLRTVLPRAPMALSTGRGLLTERVPVGEAIDRAVRDVRETRPGDIAIDEVTAGLLDARFDVERTESGYRLHAVSAPRHTTRTLLGRETPCVGRARELAIVEMTFRACIDEPSAQCVLVTGAAGIGKSRFCEELLAKLSAEPRASVWTARGDAIRAGAPFALLAQIFAPPDALRPRVASVVDRGDVDRITCFLSEMAGLPCDGDHPQMRAARADAALMSDQIRRAWEDWIAAECRAGPRILVLEDVHWGDLPSLQLVDAALRHAHELPLFVIATGRPEVHEAFPNLFRDRHAQELRLGELSRKVSLALARDVLGEGTTDATLERIVDRASGNALWLEELIRAVAEGRGDALPETVLAMMQARLEQLPGPQRRLLRAASVFGERFWVAGTRALFGGDPRSGDVEEALADLVAREIVRRAPASKLAHEVEYSFQHALVRDAAYSMLTDDDRRLAHALAGEWLADHGEPSPFVLAEHFEKGGVRARAAQEHVRCAALALDGNDLASAIDRAERAASLGIADRALASARLIQAEAHLFRGDFEAARSYARAARAAFEPDRKERFHALTLLVRASRSIDAHDEILRAAEEVGSASPAEGEARVSWAIATGVVCLRLLEAGDARRATSLERTLAEVASRTDDDRVHAWLERVGSFRCKHERQYLRALQLSERACERFERIGDVRGASIVRISVADLAKELGRYDDAQRSLRHVVQVGERMGLLSIVAIAQQHLVLVCARLGDAEGADVEAERARAFFAAQGNATNLAWTHVYSSVGLTLCAQPQRAEAEASRALDTIGDRGSSLCAYALGARAAARLSLGDATAALNDAREAMDIVGRAGGIEEGEALVRLMWAEASWATGDRDGARRSIENAAALLSATAASVDDATTRRSFLQDVPEHRTTFARLAEWMAVTSERT